MCYDSIDIKIIITLMNWNNLLQRFYRFRVVIYIVLTLFGLFLYILSIYTSGEGVSVLGVLNSLGGNGPKIEYVQPSGFVTDYPRTQDLIFRVEDSDSVKLTSIEATVIAPHLFNYFKRYVYTYGDLDFHYEEIESGYQVKLEHREKLPDFNTIYLIIKAEDVSGKIASRFLIFSTADTFLSLMLSFPLYFIAVVLIGCFLLETPVKIIMSRVNSILVYDSVTKAGVVQCIVRLFREDKLVETKVTDLRGLVDFKKVDEGTYRIQVISSNYKFPSKLKPKSKDGKFTNLYYGGDIVKRDGDRINVNIPVDPLISGEKIVSVSRLKRGVATILSNFESRIFLFIAVADVILFYRYVSSYIHALIFIGVYLIHRTILTRLEGKKGKVMDKQRKSLSGITLEIYNKEFENLFAHTVTDSKGEYQFYVPPGRYFIALSSGGYEFVNSESPDKYDIDVSYVDENIIVAPHLTLKKVQEEKNDTEDDN
jgi:hypothetical protein